MFSCDPYEESSKTSRVDDIPKSSKTRETRSRRNGSLVSPTLLVPRIVGDPRTVYTWKNPSRVWATSTLGPQNSVVVHSLFQGPPPFTLWSIRLTGVGEVWIQGLGQELKNTRNTTLLNVSLIQNRLI